MFAKAEYAAAFTQLLSLGAYLGILCDTKFFGGTHREIHNTSIFKGVMRTLLTVIIFSPFLALSFIKVNDSFMWILFMVYIIPAFVAGFVFFAFSRLLFEKFKLVASDVTVKIQDDGRRFIGKTLSDISYDSETDDECDGSC